MNGRKAKAIRRIARRMADPKETGKYYQRTVKSGPLGLKEYVVGPITMHPRNFKKIARVIRKAYTRGKIANTFALRGGAS